MAWIPTAKDIYWLLGVIAFLLVGYWRLAIRANKSKERLEKVDKNENNIKALQEEMVNIKDDINEIKIGVGRQTEDSSAMMKALQSIMNALYDRDCNIGPAREKFNDYLSERH